MDGRSDLNLAVNCNGQSARGEEICWGSLIGILSFVLHDYIHIICELIEFLLVDEA